MAKPKRQPKRTELKLSPEEQLVLLARREPVTFAREVLNHRRLDGEASLDDDPDQSWELDDFQCELLEALADVWRKLQNDEAARHPAAYPDYEPQPLRTNREGHPWISVRACHGPGKTHLAALVAHVFNAAWHGRIVATAPKFDQLKTRLWTAFRRVSNRAEPWYRRTYDVAETAVYWLDAKGAHDKEHCMLAETATKPENMQGHHHTYQLIIVDEASGIPEAIVPVMEGALSRGVIQIMFMIGNATKEQGYFADSHRKRETAEQFCRYHVHEGNSRRLRLSRSWQTWAARLVRKYGEDSPVVRVRVKGEFPGSSPNQLIALEWIERARQRTVDLVNGDGSLPRLRVSVDCGGGGENETVVTVARHWQSFYAVLRIERHSFPLATATMDTVRAALGAFEAFGGRKPLEAQPSSDDFVVDALGVGLGVAGVLREDGYAVVFYQGGAASDDPKRWRNRRVQSYLNLRNDFQYDQIVLLETAFEDQRDWDDFDAQLCSIQSPPGSERVEDLITKERMIEMGMQSPDIADSLAMQKATQTPVAKPVAPGQLNQDQLPVCGETKVLEGFM